MRRVLTAGVMGLLLMAGAVVSASAAIQGDYMEVRSADVYTGPCVANGEVGLVGNQAILAWKVRAGNWQGTDVSGLGVVAVVKASATLGDPYHTPYPAKAVLILDERANAQQRQALTEFAKSMGGQLLDDVVRVETAPINMEVSGGHHDAHAKLVAGTLARIELGPFARATTSAATSLFTTRRSLKLRTPCRSSRSKRRSPDRAWMSSGGGPTSAARSWRRSRSSASS